MTDVDVMDKVSAFRCRKCRIRLFSAEHLESHVDQKLSSKVDVVDEVDLSNYDKCSSWFLKGEDMLPWIAESVEEAQWTEGKIYCPKCKSRIGAFDFIHGIQCNCGKFVIPAIWIQKCRVDHIFPKSQLTNLDIRKPVSTDLRVSRKTATYSNTMTQNVMDLSDVNVHELEKFCSSQNTTDHTEDGNEGLDNYRSCDQAAFVSNPCQSGESSFTSCHHCEQCWNTMCLQETCICEEHKNSVGSKNQTTQRLSSKNSCVCSSNVDEALESCNSTTSRLLQVKINEGSLPTQRSNRIKKGQHQDRSLEEDDLDVHVHVSTEPRVAADKNAYSCLTVDEGFDETMPVRDKAVLPEIKEHHCCAVCLDLLYEPFKCSCNHVFCDPCLRQLNFRTGRKGTIRCPLCRQIVEHITPASEIRSEIRSSYDSHILRKREKAERRAPYRKWPLPSSRGPLLRPVSRTQRSVTLPCIICIFLVCACLYSLVVIVVLSSLTDGIKIY